MIFTVVIPAYNREKEIVRAINSVLEQTFQDFEIVVVDDGSKDGTRVVVESFLDNRIRYIYQNNSGACVARNTGIENAHGKLVSFLDSDDAWHKTMLEKQYKVYQSDKDVGCVYSNIQMVSIVGKRYPFGRSLGIQGYCYSDVLKQGYMAPTTVLSAKRECLEAVGKFDVLLPASQDDDMCFKLAKHYKVGYIDEVLADMYVGQINRISNNSKRVADGWWMLWNKYEMDVAELCGHDVMKKHFKDCLFRYSAVNDPEMVKKACEKYSFYGGKLTLKDIIKMKIQENSFLYRCIRKLTNI